MVRPSATSTGAPFPSTRNDPSFDVTTIAPSSIATSPSVLNPLAGSIESSFAFTLSSAPPSGWYRETLPCPSRTVTSFPSRENEACVSRPNTSRLPWLSAMTVAPSPTLRLSPLKTTALGRSGSPPSVAFLLPATDPTTADPAKARTESNVTTNTTMAATGTNELRGVKSLRDIIQLLLGAQGSDSQARRRQVTGCLLRGRRV